jgi:hypothetical protein
MLRNTHVEQIGRTLCDHHRLYHPQVLCLILILLQDRKLDLFPHPGRYQGWGSNPVDTQCPTRTCQLLTAGSSPMGCARPLSLGFDNGSSDTLNGCLLRGRQTRRVGHDKLAGLSAGCQLHWRPRLRISGLNQTKRVRRGCATSPSLGQRNSPSN